MRKLVLLSIVMAVGLTSCQPGTTEVTAPADYTFLRDGDNTVFMGGQTDRLAMGVELGGALKDFSKSAIDLKEMFANEDADGNDVDPYASASLNASSKSVRSKTASSVSYFGSNASSSAAIKSEFDNWISLQVSDVYAMSDSLAAPGVAGQIADGSSARYVNAMGLEYDQVILKGLIGAFATDQILNNYLDPLTLDAGSNLDDNDNALLETDENYTTMEHKWDEGYGYLFGGASDKVNPMSTLGTDDSFLNKYLGKVITDTDFSDKGDVIFNAFKLGRAAIVAGNYEVRDEQVAIIRETISEVIGIRAVKYLEDGKDALASSDFGGAFHDLSEGYGFVYSLQFTRHPESGAPYFSQSEVEGFLTDMMNDGTNGLWDVQSSTLSTIASDIAARFDFTVLQVTN